MGAKEFAMKLLAVLCAICTAALPASKALAQGDNAAPTAPGFTDRAAEARGDVTRDSAGNLYVIERDAYGNVLRIRREGGGTGVPPGSRQYWGGGPAAPGVYLPPEARSRERIVRNWGARGLQRPPPRHEWMQIGDQYVLVDRSNGLVRETHSRR
jgi:Ni/Co efflux regulator RcnB